MKKIVPVSPSKLRVFNPRNKSFLYAVDQRATLITSTTIQGVDVEQVKCCAKVFVEKQLDIKLKTTIISGGHSIDVDSIELVGIDFFDNHCVVKQQTILNTRTPVATDDKEQAKITAVSYIKMRLNSILKSMDYRHLPQGDSVDIDSIEIVDATKIDVLNKTWKIANGIWSVEAK